MHTMLSMALRVDAISRPSNLRRETVPNSIKQSCAKRQLFGSPEPGECSAMYEEIQKENLAKLRKYELCQADEPSNNCVPSCKAMTLPACKNTHRDTKLRCPSGVKSKSRAQPYPIQTKNSVADFYKSRKNVPIQNRTSDVRAVDDVVAGLVPQPMQQIVGISISARNSIAHDDD